MEWTVNIEVHLWLIHIYRDFRHLVVKNHGAGVEILCFVVEISYRIIKFEGQHQFVKLETCGFHRSIIRLEYIFALNNLARGLATWKMTDADKDYPKCYFLVRVNPKKITPKILMEQSGDSFYQIIRISIIAIIEIQIMTKKRIAENSQVLPKGSFINLVDKNGKREVCKNVYVDNRHIFQKYFFKLSFFAVQFLSIFCLILP